MTTTTSSRGSFLHGPLDDGSGGNWGGSAPAERSRQQAAADPEIIRVVRDLLRHGLPAEYLDPFSPAGPRYAAVQRLLRAAVGADKQNGGLLAGVPTDDETARALFSATWGWGPAQKYFDDERVQEVKIVGRTIYVQEAGQGFVVVPDVFATTAEITQRARNLASALAVRLDDATPQTTIPVGLGTRMHVTIPPRADAPLVCVRRGRSEAWDLNHVFERGSLDARVVQLLQLFVRARCSFLIAGATGSGKTGLLEALVNSWPGTPHIITIEDQTFEIGIRHAETWTREKVNSQADRAAYGRAAYEALRQRPDVLAPGETRAEEAGAILYLAMSDHPVLTTLHAASCLEAVQRFAGYAAMPGATLYAGRHADALRDTCSAFHVVIHLENWEEHGRRVVSEVALLAGWHIDATGQVCPLLVPLVTVDVVAGTIVWHCTAQPVNGRLEWRDGRDLTPPALARRLARAAARAHLKTAAPTIDTVAAAIEKAEKLLAADQADRALAVLRSAWAERGDARLLSLARRVVAALGPRAVVLANSAKYTAEAIEEALGRYAYRSARDLYRELTARLDRLAAWEPVAGGWPGLDARIGAGMRREADVEQRCTDSFLALRSGDAGRAFNVLRDVETRQLSLEARLSLIKARQEAMAALVAAGEGSEHTLASLQSQREGIEVQIATAHYGVTSDE